MNKQDNTSTVGIMFEELMQKIDHLSEQIVRNILSGKTDSDIPNSAVVRIMDELRALRSANNFSPEQIATLEELLLKVMRFDDNLAALTVGEPTALLKEVLKRLEAIEATQSQFSDTQPHPASSMLQLPPKSTVYHKHSLILDFKNIKAAGVLAITGFALLLSLGGNIHQYSLDAQYRDNDLKYRYIRMCGGISPNSLHSLERWFNDPDSAFVVKNIRRAVFEHEENVRKQVPVPGQALHEPEKPKPKPSRKR